MSGNQAWIIDASSGSPSYVSQDIRQMMAALVANGTTRTLGGRSGYLPGRQPTTLSITGSSPNFSYSVSAFAAVIDPAFSATQAPYLVKTDAANTGTITAPNGSNPRKDVVYAQVQDTVIDGSTFRRLLIGIQAGTPAASPAEPAPPAGALTLSVITVPTLGGGTPTIVVKNLFTVAAGGLLPCATVADLPSSPYAGMPAYLTDSNTQVFYDGTSWRPTATTRQEITATIDGPGASQPPGGSTTILSTTITTTAPATIELDAHVSCYLASAANVAGTVLLQLNGSTVRTLRLFWHTVAGGQSVAGIGRLFVPTAGTYTVALTVASDAGSAGGSLIVPECASYAIREIR